MMSPAESASALRSTIHEITHLFDVAPESRTTIPVRPGDWCARQILGHLIDSACNNHRRFVVGQSPETTRFDGYDQDAWVSRQCYAEESWADLVALWRAYNHHLAHVMSCTSDA